ncbi:MAG: excinuclease ABC subunit UvrB, partial [Chlamydiae bacterium]|nr:excinuclease ABC subunit UvrB [Chlamydiota bacterium]
REDVLIVSSVSCIYGLGTPEYYKDMQLVLQVGDERRRDEVLLHLVEMQYVRNEYELSRATFRSRGDILDIMPAYEEDRAFRVSFFGDEIEKISEIDPLTGRVRGHQNKIVIFPSSHHVTPQAIRDQALTTIRQELQERLSFYEQQDRLLEKQRIKERTLHDMEMIKEVGTCKGIENYSRHFSMRRAGDPPPCLLDYFPKDFLLFIDESHQTMPQIRAMYNGDRARKESLVEFGFRLPSAFDNRPLRFEEFYKRMHQVIYVSATPAPWELEEAGGVLVQQVIRPTGLLDPEITLRPATLQVEDCLEEIRKEKEKGGRVLVTALTKKLSEDVASYLSEIGVKAKYLHSEIVTLERVQILNELRAGIFDVLVGVNLLREGLDIPEVSLVVILDADKEGFLRSETALIQTCGRAARNAQGRVILYADKQTKAIQKTMEITSHRRELQKAYNIEHGIIPRTVHRSRAEALLETFGDITPTEEVEKPTLTAKEIDARIKDLTTSMKKAAKDLQFEEAARYRDELRHYQQLQLLEEGL